MSSGPTIQVPRPSPHIEVPAIGSPCRLVDAHRHFLGLVKGQAFYCYCRLCKRFVVILVSTDISPTSRSPETGAARGA